MVSGERERERERGREREREREREGERGSAALSSGPESPSRGMFVQSTISELFKLGEARGR